MPKRIPTPPPPEDEPRYLTVVHPYPLNANLMTHADRRTLALWLACCTGKDVLLAMYYKPAARGTVIIEVDRDFDQFETLLGSHSWSKFLLRPSGEEQDKESKVFWCHYNSGRLVQKHGWKRVDIEEHWFKGWSPKNAKIRFPYPKTTWCEVPSEAKTSVPLCRPLPQAHFPTPKSAPQPPVGSPAWVSAKSSDTSSVATSSSRRKGVKSIAPSDSVSMVSSASSGSGTNKGAQSTAASTVSTAWRVAEYRARQGASSWARGPLSVASIASHPGSRAPSTIGSGQGSHSHSSRGSAGLPTKPPGLNLKYDRFDWGEEVDRFEAESDDGPPSASIVSGGPRGSDAPPRYVPDPQGPVDPDQEYEYDDDNRPKRSIADAMKEAFDGDSDDELTQDWPRDTRVVDDDRDPWNGYDAPKWEPPTKINTKGGEKWQCPDHGPLCNPGICKERARVELERRRQKEQEERQEAKRRREEKWEREKKKKENREAKAAGRDLPHDLPPHLAGGSDGGSDSSSSSDGNSTGDETEGNEGSDAGIESGERSRPPTNLDGEDMWATRRPWGDDDDDDDDYEAPKVNIVVRRAPSLANTDYDERERGPPPSLPNDARSVTSSSTGTNVQDSKSNVSRGTAAGRQPPGNTRSSANVSSAASSASGDAPAGAQSPVPGQRESAWGTRSATGSRPTAPSVRDTQDDVDVASTQSRPAPGQRQPASKPRSTSSSTAASSVGSNRPTGSYASSVSQFSSTGQRAAERDSRGSTTLLNTASSAAGRHRPSRVARTSSSTSGRTAVSSESAPPDGGFPTFDDTEWGDTISAAQNRPKQKKGSDAGGNDEADEEKTNQSEHNTTGTGKTNQSEQNITGTGKKYRGWTKGRGGGKKFAAKRRGAPQPQSDTLSVALDIDLQPGGPGSAWGNGNEAW